MIRAFVLACMLPFLAACAENEKSLPHTPLTDGLLYTPGYISPGWVEFALEQIKKRRVERIVCSTEGGDAQGAAAIAHAVYASKKPLLTIVPEGHSCISAGAIIWFASAYRTAYGSVMVHSPIDGQTGEIIPSRNAEFVHILARAGAPATVQAQFWLGKLELYRLNDEEIRLSSRSP